MKTLCSAIIALVTMSAPSTGASVTVSDTSSALPGVAATAASLLVDAGLSPQNIGGGSFAVEARDFHCDHSSRMALDASNPRAALPTDACRINAKNLRGTKTGQVFSNGRAMGELLQQIQGSSGNGGVQFSDCAMGGYCGTFVKSIKCIINTRVENFQNGGRWTCTFIDGQ